MLDRLTDVADAPVGDRAARPWTGHRLVGIQAQLIARDVEADVERLIEIRLLLKRGRIPRLRAVEIGHVINDGGESADHFGPWSVLGAWSFV